MACPNHPINARAQGRAGRRLTGPAPRHVVTWSHHAVLGSSSAAATTNSTLCVHIRSTSSAACLLFSTLSACASVISKYSPPEMRHGSSNGPCTLAGEEGRPRPGGGFGQTFTGEVEDQPTLRGTRSGSVAGRAEVSAWSGSRQCRSGRCGRAVVSSLTPSGSRPTHLPRTGGGAADDPSRISGEVY